MQLQIELKEKLKEVDLLSLAKKIGYNNAQKGKERILTLLQSGYLGLWAEDANFDMVHSNSTLLKALCDALEIEASLYEKTLYAIEMIQEVTQKAFYKHIYIHTDFKRKNEPIIAMAALESKRRITNLYLLEQYSLKKQIQEVSEIVKNHFERHHGKLDLWGDIKSYVYHYDVKKEPIVFDTKGRVIQDKVSESFATLSLK